MKVSKKQDFLLVFYRGELWLHPTYTYGGLVPIRDFKGKLKDPFDAFDEPLVTNVDYSSNLDYLKKSYIRCGYLPHDGNSWNYLKDKAVEGVCVFEAIYYGKELVPVLPIYPTKNKNKQFKHLSELELLYERPCFEVTGELLGLGPIGEPRLTNVKILRPIHIKLRTLNLEI